MQILTNAKQFWHDRKTDRQPNHDIPNDARHSYKPKAIRLPSLASLFFLFAICLIWLEILMKETINPADYFATRLAEVPQHQPRKRLDTCPLPEVGSSSLASLDQKHSDLCNDYTVSFKPFTTDLSPAVAAKFDSWLAVYSSMEAESDAMKDCGISATASASLSSLLDSLTSSSTPSATSSLTSASSAASSSSDSKTSATSASPSATSSTPSQTSSQQSTTSASPSSTSRSTSQTSATTQPTTSQSSTQPTSSSSTSQSQSSSATSQTSSSTSIKATTSSTIESTSSSTSSSVSTTSSSTSLTSSTTIETTSPSTTTASSETSTTVSSTAESTSSLTTTPQSSTSDSTTSISSTPEVTTSEPTTSKTTSPSTAVETSTTDLSTSEISTSETTTAQTTTSEIIPSDTTSTTPVISSSTTSESNTFSSTSSTTVPITPTTEETTSEITTTLPSETTTEETSSLLTTSVESTATETTSSEVTTPEETTPTTVASETTTSETESSNVVSAILVSTTSESSTPSPTTPEQTTPDTTTVETSTTSEETTAPETTTPYISTPETTTTETSGTSEETTSAVMTSSDTSTSEIANIGNNTTEVSSTPEETTTPETSTVETTTATSESTSTDETTTSETTSSVSSSTTTIIVITTSSDLSSTTTESSTTATSIESISTPTVCSNLYEPCSGCDADECYCAQALVFRMFWRRQNSYYCAPVDPCKCQLNNETGLYDCYDGNSSVNYCTPATTTPIVTSTTTSEDPSTTTAPITSSTDSVCAGSFQACGVKSMGIATNRPECCSGYACDLTILSCTPAQTSTPEQTTTVITTSVTSSSSSSDSICAGSFQACGVKSMGIATDRPECCSGYACDLTILSCTPEQTSTTAAPTITSSTEPTCAGSAQACGVASLGFTDSPDCCSGYACDLTMLYCVPEVASTTDVTTTTAEPDLVSTSTEAPVLQTTCAAQSQRCDASFTTMGNATYTLAGCCGDLACNSGFCEPTSVISTTSPLATTDTTTAIEITSEPVATNATSTTETSSESPTTSSGTATGNTTLDATLVVTCAVSSMACSTDSALIGTSMYSIAGCCDGLTCNSGLCFAMATSTLAPYTNSTTTTTPPPLLETTCAGASQLCSTSSTIIGTGTYSVTGCCSGYECNTVCKLVESTSTSLIITSTLPSNDTTATVTTEFPANITTTESSAEVTTNTTDEPSPYINSTTTSIGTTNTTAAPAITTPNLATTCAVDSQSCSVDSTYFSSTDYALTGCCAGYECDQTFMACVPTITATSDTTTTETTTTASNDTITTTTMAPEVTFITTCAVDYQACSADSTYFSSKDYVLTGCCDGYECDQTIMACIPMTATPTDITTSDSATTETITTPPETTTSESTTTTDIPTNMNATTTTSDDGTMTSDITTTSTSSAPTCTAYGDPCTDCEADMCICESLGPRKRQESSDSYYCEIDFCHCQQDSDSQWHCGDFDICEDYCSGPYSEDQACYDSCEGDFCVCKSGTCTDTSKDAATTTDSSTTDVSTPTTIPTTAINSTMFDNSTDTTYQNITSNSTTNFDSSSASNYTNVTSAIYPNITSDPVANSNGSSATNYTQTDAIYPNTTSAMTTPNYSESNATNYTTTDAIYPNVTDVSTTTYNETVTANYTANDVRYPNTTNSPTTMSYNEGITSNYTTTDAMYPNVTSESTANYNESTATNYTENNATYANTTSGLNIGFTATDAMYPNVTSNSTANYNESIATNYTSPELQYPNATEDSAIPEGPCSSSDSEGSYCYDGVCADGWPICTCQSGICTEPPACSGFHTKCYSCEDDICTCGDPSLFTNYTTTDNTCRMSYCDCMIDPVNGWWNCGDYDTCTDPCSAPNMEGQACEGLCGAENCICSAGTCEIDNTQVNKCGGPDYYGNPYSTCNTCGTEYCTCYDDTCYVDTSHCVLDYANTWRTYICGEFDVYADPCSSPLSEGDSCSGCGAGSCSCQSGTCQDSTLLNATCQVDGSCDSCGADKCRCRNFDSNMLCKPDSCHCAWDDATRSWQCGDVDLCEGLCQSMLNASIPEGWYASCYSCSEQSCICSDGSCTSWPDLYGDDACTYYERNPGDPCHSCGTDSCECGYKSSNDFTECLEKAVSISSTTTDPDSSTVTTSTPYEYDSTSSSLSNLVTTTDSTTTDFPYGGIIQPIATYEADGTPTDKSYAESSSFTSTSTSDALDGGSLILTTPASTPGTTCCGEKHCIMFGDACMVDSCYCLSDDGLLTCGDVNYCEADKVCDASASLRCSGCRILDDSEDGCYCTDAGVCTEVPCQNCVISSDGKTMMCPDDASCESNTDSSTVAKRYIDSPSYNHTRTTIIGPVRPDQRNQLRATEPGNVATRRSSTHRSRSQGRTSEHTPTFNTSKELKKKRQLSEHIKSHAVIGHDSHAHRVRSIWGAMDKRDGIEVLPPGYEDPVPDAWNYLLWTEPLTIRRTSGSIVTTTVAATFTLDVFSDGSTSFPSLTATPPLATQSTIPACIPATFIRPAALAKRDSGQSVLGVQPYVSRSSTTVTVGIRDNYLVMTSNLPTITQGLATATAAALKDSNGAGTAAAQNNGNAAGTAAAQNNGNAAGTAAAQNNGNAAGTAANNGNGAGQNNGNAGVTAANNGNTAGTAAAQNNGNAGGATTGKNNGNVAGTAVNNGNAGGATAAQNNGNAVGTGQAQNNGNVGGTAAGQNNGNPANTAGGQNNGNSGGTATGKNNGNAAGTAGSNGNGVNTAAAQKNGNAPGTADAIVAMTTQTMQIQSIGSDGRRTTQSVVVVRPAATGSSSGSLADLSGSSDSGFNGGSNSGSNSYPNSGYNTGSGSNSGSGFGSNTGSDTGSSSGSSSGSNSGSNSNSGSGNGSGSGSTATGHGVPDQKFGNTEKVVNVSFNLGTYVAAMYLPTIMAVIIKILFETMVASIKMMEPFERLHRSQGATADDSLCSQYLSSSLSTDVFTSIWHGRSIPLWTLLIYVLITIAAPLSSSAMTVKPMDMCLLGGVERLCDPAWIVDIKFVRVIEALLAACLVLTFVLAWDSWHYHAGVATNPTSIASIAVLLNYEPLRQDLQKIEPDATEEETFKALEEYHFWLIPHDPSRNENRYGIVHSPKRNFSTAELNIEPGFLEKITTKITSSFHDRYGTMLPKLTPKQMSRISDALHMFTSITLLAILITYCADHKTDAFNRFFVLQDFWPKFLLMCISSILDMQWKNLEREIRITDPYRRLAFGNARPENTILCALNGTCWSNTPASLRRFLKYEHMWFETMIGLCAILSDINIIAVSGVIWTIAQTKEAYYWSTITGLACTGIMTLALAITMFWWRHDPTINNLPRMPETISAVLSYICTSRMAADFAAWGMENQTDRERDDVIINKGRRYRFARLLGEDGQMRWCVDYDEEVVLHEAEEDLDLDRDDRDSWVKKRMEQTAVVRSN